jgi:hypothetical protein
VGRFLLLLLGCGGVGCHSVGHPKAHESEFACHTTTVTAPAPKIEVETPETIVVKAPQPKVVYEQPCPPNQGPGFGGAPQNNQFGAGQPNVPPGMVQMPVQPGFGAAPGLLGNAILGSAILGSEINERTSIGFMFDTIKIPIPWIRLKAIPRPTEVTFRTQLAPQGFGSPVAVGATGFGAAPAQNFGAAPVGFGGGQVVNTGVQYVPVSGTIPVQVPTGNVPVAGGNTGTGGFGAAPTPPDTTADAVEKLKQKLKECEELQKQIKSLQPTEK